MKTKSIKTLHIFSGVGGGISTWIRKASQFSDGKYTIDAMAFSVTNKSSFIDIIEDNGGNCYEMPRIRNGVIGLIKYVVMIIEKNQYDVIHCHIDGYSALPFWIATKKCKKKLIIHSHRTAIEKVAGKKYENAIYAINRVANVLLAKYKVACGEMAAAFAFGNSTYVKILYNGINPILPLEVEEDNRSRTINLLALGRLNVVKNHLFMLKVAKSLKEKHVPFHLFIVGDGDLKDEITEKIIELGLCDEVSMEGYCNTPELYLQRCDVFLMPSFSEGLPTVMLEAQGYGCNIISSDRVTKECDLGLGLVSYVGISENDIDVWAELIKKYSENKVLISQEVINSAMCEKGFINQKIYDDYYSYIKEIVEK